MREFVRIELDREPRPEDRIACKFRHQPEKHELATRMFSAINHYPALKGIKVSSGAIGDATTMNKNISQKTKTRNVTVSLTCLKFLMYPDPACQGITFSGTCSTTFKLSR